MSRQVLRGRCGELLLGFGELAAERRDEAFGTRRDSHAIREERTSDRRKKVASLRRSQPKSMIGCHSGDRESRLNGIESVHARVAVNNVPSRGKRTGIADRVALDS